MHAGVRFLLFALALGTGLSSAQEALPQLALAEQAYAQTLKDHRDGQVGFHEVCVWASLAFHAQARGASPGDPSYDSAMAAFLERLKRTEAHANSEEDRLELDAIRKMSVHPTTEASTRASIATLSSVVAALSRAHAKGNVDPERLVFWSSSLRHQELNLARGEFGDSDGAGFRFEAEDDSDTLEPAEEAHRKRMLSLYTTVQQRVEAGTRPRIALSHATYYLNDAPLDPAKRRAYDELCDNAGPEDNLPLEPEESAAEACFEAAANNYATALRQYRAKRGSAYRVWLWSARMRTHDPAIRISNGSPKPSAHLLRIRGLAKLARNLLKTLPPDVAHLLGREEEEFRRSAWDQREGKRGSPSAPTPR